MSFDEHELVQAVHIAQLPVATLDGGRLAERAEVDHADHAALDDE